MRLGIRGKQIAGVTAIVGLAVVALSALYVARLADVIVSESYARAELLANAILHRARQVVTEGGDPHAALRTDPGLLAILESSIYGESVEGAAILDAGGIVVAHSDATLVGRSATPREDLGALDRATPVRQLQEIYWGDGQTREVRHPMSVADEALGSVRIGVSTLLMRQALTASLRPALFTAVAAVLIAVIVAGLLAQLLLRPIHVIRSGLTRLGRGEFGVTLDLPPGDEFGELGSFFNTISQQLSADRTLLAGQKANLQSAVEHLEDAVALFNPAGELLFSNPAMQPIFPADAIGRAMAALLPNGHPYRTAVEETLASRTSRGPVQIIVPAAGADDSGPVPRGSGLAGPNPQSPVAASRVPDPESRSTRSASTGLMLSRIEPARAESAEGREERLIMTHAISGADGALVGVLLVSRNLAHLSRMQSTIAYSRKLVALGRLTAGIAHEVKNPLNAMMIHLELLRTKIRHAAREPVTPGVALVDARGGGGSLSDSLQHVAVIEMEIRRLDEVVQGFLKFTRPEDLRLQPVRVSTLFDEILPIVGPEAQTNNVRLVVECPATAPCVNGDAAMLRQAFLNLAINACQAMPDGGVLRLVCSPAGRDRVEIRVEDSGLGIPPADLGRIFDLYFTTKDHGTGIGLSMVYRIVQMHDGEIEVQSTPGRGTTFRVLLPRVSEI